MSNGRASPSEAQYEHYCGGQFSGTFELYLHLYRTASTTARVHDSTVFQAHVGATS